MGELERGVSRTAIYNVLVRRAHWWGSGGVDGYRRLLNLVRWCHVCMPDMLACTFDGTTEDAIRAIRPQAEWETRIDFQRALRHPERWHVTPWWRHREIAYANALNGALISGEVFRLLAKLARKHVPRTLGFDYNRGPKPWLLTGPCVFPRPKPWLLTGPRVFPRPNGKARSVNEARRVGFSPVLAMPYGDGKYIEAAARDLRPREGHIVTCLPHADLWLKSQVKIKPLFCANGKHVGPFECKEYRRALRCCTCKQEIPWPPIKEAS
jgi:hypothetical protein